MSDSVHMYYSNSQLTIWVEGNVSVHVEKEDKQVKNIIMLPHHNMTILAKDCHVKLNVESVYTYKDCMWLCFLPVLVCLPTSVCFV